MYSKMRANFSNRHTSTKKPNCWLTSNPREMTTKGHNPLESIHLLGGASLPSTMAGTKQVRNASSTHRTVVTMVDLCFRYLQFEQSIRHALLRLAIDTFSIACTMMRQAILYDELVALPGCVAML